MPVCIEGDHQTDKIVGRKRCTKHYQQWRAANAPECCEDGCTKPAQAKKRCPQHYQQWRTAQRAAEAPVRPDGVWLPVVGFEGLYEVSDRDGLIWSLPRATTSGGLVNPRPNDRGYLIVTLSKAGEHSTHYVHILVLTAHRGACPVGKEGAHDDGDNTNNDLTNLWWKTHSDNLNDRWRHGTIGNSTHCPWGHEWTAGDSYMVKNSKACLTCNRSRQCRNPECTRPNHDHVNTPWPAGAASLVLT